MAILQEKQQNFLFEIKMTYPILCRTSKGNIITLLGIWILLGTICYTREVCHKTDRVVNVELLHELSYEVHNTSSLLICEQKCSRNAIMP